MLDQYMKEDDYGSFEVGPFYCWVHAYEYDIEISMMWGSVQLKRNVPYGITLRTVMNIAVQVATDYLNGLLEEVRLSSPTE